MNLLYQNVNDIKSPKANKLSCYKTEIRTRKTIYLLKYLQKGSPGVIQNEVG